MRSGRSPHYCGELNERSQSAFQTSITPLTAAPRISAWFDQISGMAAAVPVIILSTFAQAWWRAVGSLTADAASIAAFIFGSLRTDQFELFTGTIAFPLNGT